MSRAKGNRPVWVILLAVLGLVFSWGAVQESPRERVTARFRTDQVRLEVLAQQVLASGDTREALLPKDWKGIQLYNANSDLVTVEFSFGGSGFGSETAYRGVNYVPCGKPLGFQGQWWDCWKAQGHGRLYYDPEGDNTCYVEELAPGWYYYEARF